MDASQQIEPTVVAHGASVPTLTCQCIEWYHDGQSRLVSVNGIDVVIRLVGRKNRKARIAIEAPAGALFRSLEHKTPNPR